MANLTMSYKTIRKSRLRSLAARLFQNHMSAISSLDLNIGIVCTFQNRVSENISEI